jgi:ssDNA-binding Zn-finger/Zn-ribbon topoisomerase 1
MKNYNCLSCSKENVWSRHKINKFCDNKCQQNYQFNKYIAEWKSGLQDGRKGKLQTSGYIHRYVLEKYNYSCTVCGISEWNKQPIVLELEHIDGNGFNNNEDNLRVLCPNCHSQTKTYKSKNKGSGRQHRL